MNTKLSLLALWKKETSGRDVCRPRNEFAASSPKNVDATSSAGFIQPPPLSTSLKADSVRSKGRKAEDH